MWYLYILLCRNGCLYTGITKDIARRFKEHKKGSARYTSYNPPLKVLYSETFKTRSAALKRECEIKRWPRKRKFALIRKGDRALYKG